jgi:hypothetical protein
MIGNSCKFVALYSTRASFQTQKAAAELHIAAPSRLKKMPAFRPATGEAVNSVCYADQGAMPVAATATMSRGRMRWRGVAVSTTS